jgi:HEAT repeat protein
MPKRPSGRHLLWVVMLFLALPANASRDQRLARYVEKDPSYKVRIRAVLALGKLKPSRALPILSRALDDPHSLVRLVALSLLSKQDSAAVFTLLKAFVKREGNSRVLRRARLLLRGMQRKRSVACLPAPY